jgi:peptide/nickel transport system ATP-binding protein
MMPLTDAHHVRCVRLHDASLQLLSLPPLLDRPQALSSDHSVLLSVKDLSVAYAIGGGIFGSKKTFQAVDKVSFDIQKGQTLALVGESGCGKTTIGKALLQLLTPQTQIGGQAFLNGKDLFTLKGQELQESRRQLQIIFQNPFGSLNPRMRVLEILEEGMKSLHPEWSSDQRRIDLSTLMDQVGLRADALDRYPHEFSGGQRQRINIARSFYENSDIVIFDESINSVDENTKITLVNNIFSYFRNKTVIFVLHDKSFLKRFDKVFEIFIILSIK